MMKKLPSVSRIAEEPLDTTTRIAIGHAPADRRAALAAVFALDARLRRTVASTREPMIGQLRLAWWREALERLDTAPPPGEPVLRAISDAVLPHGVSGADLAESIAGWEPLVAAATLDAGTMQRYAHERGERVFDAASRVLGGGGPQVAAAGRAWAYADFARRPLGGAAAPAVRRSARMALDESSVQRWPNCDRPLGILALLMVAEIDDSSRWKTAMSFMRFRITGRY